MHWKSEEDDGPGWINVVALGFRRLGLAESGGNSERVTRQEGTRRDGGCVFRVGETPFWAD